MIIARSLRYDPSWYLCDIIHIAMWSILRYDPSWYHCDIMIISLRYDHIAMAIWSTTPCFSETTRWKHLSVVIANWFVMNDGSIWRGEEYFQSQIEKVKNSFCETIAILVFLRMRSGVEVGKSISFPIGSQKFLSLAIWKLVGNVEAATQINSFREFVGKSISFRIGPQKFLPVAILRPIGNVEARFYLPIQLILGSDTDQIHGWH